MAKYLLTYDLESTEPDPHDVFKSALQRAGWWDYVLINGQREYLPNTTLAGSFATDAAARAAYNAGVEDAILTAVLDDKGPINVERVYITRRQRVLGRDNT